MDKMMVTRKLLRQEVAAVNQQNNDNERRQIVPVDVGQQIQTTNKFAALEVEDEGDNEHPVILVEEVAVQDTPKQKELNPNASVFTPKSTGVASSKRGNVENVGENRTLAKEGTNKGKESTAQWVNRTFPVLNVTTNQYCQELPSQSLDTNMIPEQENLKDKVTFVGGRLWGQQHEEESDEGEFLEGHEDVEEVQDKDPDVEEQSVYGKSTKLEVQSAEEGVNVNIAAEQPLTD
ncbi:hypothetical protein A4A49_27711 [Nicotiana attenuata]|uniref:Uncharacterized protein n=1 Tax=Nicotiana attenuata TaxID=49451 RepID=A0A1J6KDJ6_NICAT|nr:hypothetical protein A4A49_27711 [Nicotiana attenuata]